MQKIYVLLRQDKQTGPYSLQELIQFDLKPYDLIWIEGQSAGWYYPQEIAALHPYLNFLPKKPVVNQVPPADKKVAVQMPVINETPPAVPLPETVKITPAENDKPFAPVSENLEEAVYAQFRKPAAVKEPVVATPSVPGKKRSPNAVVVGITSVLVIGGVFAASWIMNRHSAEEETATETVTESSVPNEITTPAVANDNEAKNKQPVFTTKNKRTKNSILPVQTTTGVKHNGRQLKDEKAPVSNSAGEAVDYEATAPSTDEEQVQQKESSSAPDETTTAPEKKKTIKDKFLDLFRKKPEENKEQESRSTETENGERVATRRESNLLQSVHVRFDVPNDWMMGIKGAKATLVNRSSEKIRSATVEVLYYNDENELLQKKTVTFGKIDAKESGTISIPDHSTATKVDYKVLSVTGAGQPSA